jgi:hypothetical protein
MLNRLTRRKLLAKTSSGVVAACVPDSGALAADPWPTKPIRVLMPFGAGGSMHPRSLYRLLHMLASVGVLEELAGEHSIPLRGEANLSINFAESILSSSQRRKLP